VLIIRNNIFETNSSSAHAFTFYLDKNIRNIKNITQELDIVDNILTINGSDNTVDPNGMIFKIADKMAFIGTIIIANDDQELKNTFETIIKNFLVEIKEIKYNIIFAGKNRNASFSPFAFNAIEAESEFLDKEYLLSEHIIKDKTELVLFSDLIKYPKYMEQFLFGKTSSIEGEVFAQ